MSIIFNYKPRKMEGDLIRKDFSSNYKFKALIKKLKKLKILYLSLGYTNEEITSILLKQILGSNSPEILRKTMEQGIKPLEIPGLQIDPKLMLFASLIMEEFSLLRMQKTEINLDDYLNLLLYRMEVSSSMLISHSNSCSSSNSNSDQESTGFNLNSLILKEDSEISNYQNNTELNEISSKFKKFSATHPKYKRKKLPISYQNKIPASNSKRLFLYSGNSDDEEEIFTKRKF